MYLLTKILEAFLGNPVVIYEKMGIRNRDSALKYESG